MTDDYLLLSTETYFRPLGLHHFYDAFSLDGRSNLMQQCLQAHVAGCTQLDTLAPEAV